MVPVPSAIQHVNYLLSSVLDESPPPYQEAAVTLYLRNIGDNNLVFYNRTGRGFSDVAAQSFGYDMIDKGKDVLLQGTSCAVPTFAGTVCAYLKPFSSSWVSQPMNLYCWTC
ncbi:tripeptidyl-peptidase 1 precursor protein [Rutstroemia sp. NJR-2017a WRK4]|nr:tripeptidyl-peptidase 1 precursor protein [Rutstroemia sp. NJR-2017a WRK4]